MSDFHSVADAFVDSREAYEGLTIPSQTKCYAPPPLHIRNPRQRGVAQWSSFYDPFLRGVFSFGVSQLEINNNRPNWVDKFQFDPKLQSSYRCSATGRFFGC